MTDSLTEKIIGAAIEVHRILGPGLLESVYEEALCYEFELRGIRFYRQAPVKMHYKDRPIKEHKIDLIVEDRDDRAIVEQKSVSQLHRYCNGSSSLLSQSNATQTRTPKQLR